MISGVTVCNAIHNTVQAGDMHDVNQWTKEQVAEWVYSLGATGKSIFTQ